MKKRLLSLLLCLVALCATIALAHAVEPRMPAESCPYCGEDVRTSITYELIAGTEDPCPCIHGKTGYGIYETFNVIEIHTCKSTTCSYREEIDTGRQVVRLTSCEGT